LNSYLDSLKHHAAGGQIAVAQGGLISLD